jgi:hypothetical protein
MDESDMSFLNDVLVQYQHTLLHEGLRTRMLNKAQWIFFVRMHSAFELLFLFYTDFQSSKSVYYFILVLFV